MTPLNYLIQEGGMSKMYRARTLVLLPIIFLIDFVSTEKKHEFWYFGVPALLFSLFYIPSMFSSRLVGLTELSPALSSQAAPYFERIIFSIYSMIRLLVFPVTLSIFNEANTISSVYFGWMIFVDTLFFLTIFYFYKKNIKIAALLSIVLVSVIPVFSPKVIAFFMAERYLYFGSIFFAMILAMLFSYIGDSLKNKSVSLYVLIFILCLFGLKTFTQTFVWHSSKTLWLATSKVSPNSARVYNNLGDIYSREGNTKKETESFQKAIELEPDYADAMFNLGLTYLKIKDIPKGREYIQSAISIKPSLKDYGLSILSAYK